jgi:hypothetical protein
MNPLINKLAPAGQDRIPSPFFLIPNSAAVSVTGPEINNGSHSPFVQQAMGLREGWMVSMVESNLEDSAGPLCGMGELPGLKKIAAWWFFHEHMFPRLKRGGSNFRRVPIRCRHNDRIY